MTFRQWLLGEDLAAETPPARPYDDAIAPAPAHAPERSDCCVAAPLVRVRVPVPGSGHSTDLLLCGHHFNASVEALVAAGARLYDHEAPLSRG